jgi:UDP-N-acetylglucosamine 2-epimerase (non-hydrolysing)
VLQEVNRIVVDMLSDYLFTADESAAGILLREGVSGEKIHFVGSLVVDTLLGHRERIADSSILADLQLIDGPMIRPFALLAFQHLSRDHGLSRLSQLQLAFSEIARRMRVVFPASATVSKLIHEADLGDHFIDHFLDGPEPWDARMRIRLIPPLGYFDFVRLIGAAKVVLTDSRSVLEESRVLGVPCITLAGDASERFSPEAAASPLVGADPERIMDAFARATQGAFSRPVLPSGRDGHAARRIVNVLLNDFVSGEPHQSRPEASPKASPVSFHRHLT